MANRFGLAGPESRWKESGSDPAGFWAGFWHGVILPISFIVSLFNPNVRIYETNNRGRLYRGAPQKLDGVDSGLSFDDIFVSTPPDRSRSGREAGLEGWPLLFRRVPCGRSFTSTASISTTGS